MKESAKINKTSLERPDLELIEICYSQPIGSPPMGCRALCRSNSRVAFLILTYCMLQPQVETIQHAPTRKRGGMLYAPNRDVTVCVQCLEFSGWSCRRVLLWPPDLEQQAVPAVLQVYGGRNTLWVLQGELLSSDRNRSNWLWRYCHKARSANAVYGTTWMDVTNIDKYWTCIIKHLFGDLLSPFQNLKDLMWLLALVAHSIM